MTSDGKLNLHYKTLIQGKLLVIIEHTNVMALLELTKIVI